MDPVRTIVEHTAAVFERTPEELLGGSRKQPIVEARQAAMWAIRQRYPSLSLVNIGEAIGGRHYSTVMYALGAVAVRAGRDPLYHERLQRLVERISASPGLALVPPRRGMPGIAPWWRRSSEDNSVQTVERGHGYDN